MITYTVYYTVYVIQYMLYTLCITQVYRTTSGLRCTGNKALLTSGLTRANDVHCSTVTVKIGKDKKRIQRGYKEDIKIPTQSNNEKNLSTIAI